MTQKNVNDDLEYNDGLGDLLRERERLEFSWAKTTIVLVCFLGIIVLGITFMFSFGKEFFKNKTDQLPPVAEESLDLRTKFSEPKVTTAEKKVVKKATPQTKKTKTAKVSKKESPKVAKKAKKASHYKYKVITGTFKNKHFAEQQSKELKKLGFDSFIKAVRNQSQNKTLFRVQAGAYKTKEASQVLRKKLEEKKIDSYLLVE